MKMIFDMTATPYSVRGSDLALIDSDGLKVHSAIQHEKHPFAAVRFFVQGKEVKPEFVVETDCVTAKKGDAVCEICFYGKSALAIRNKGFGLKIEMRNCECFDMYKKLFYTYSVKFADGHYETISCNEHYYADYYFFAGDGKFVRKKPLPFGKNKGGNCMEIQGDAAFLFGLSNEQQRFRNVTFDFEKMRKNVENDWVEFLAKMPSVPEKYRDFAEMTWFTIWSNMVPCSHRFQKDTVVMGMVGMPSIWSWDHCFNALATSFYTFETGWTQFLAPYRYQFENGSLPDAFSNDHTFIGIMKPPIHGWCFAKLMEMFPDMPEEILQKAFDCMKKQAEYWLDYRDSDGDGVPDYPQGCDSGLDNATVFIHLKNKKNFRRFIECPDLLAYLALQYGTLAKICEKTGKDGSEFLAKKETILQKLIQHCGAEDGFCSKSTYTHEVNPNARCIIDFMPLVLGQDLPEAWRKKTIEKLKRENLTKFGIASESPSSIFYRPEGYWRGPIWAPTTYLIIDGLRRMGEKELAKDLTERYLDMVVNVAKGNYENYDALSGKGLCVKGHTWTASVTMLLMHESVTEE